MNLLEMILIISSNSGNIYCWYILLARAGLRAGRAVEAAL